MSGFYWSTASVRVFCFILISVISPLKAANITEKEILWHERIVALWRDGELSLAQEEIDALKQKHPKSTLLEKLYEIEAHIALSLGEYAKARAIIENNCQNPLSAATSVTYAQALFHLGAYENLIALKDENLSALRGLARWKLGQFEAARNELVQATPSKNVLIGLIDCLFHLGEKGKAAEAIEKLLPKLSESEKKEYLLLEARALQEANPSRALELLLELVDAGVNAASYEILTHLANCENPRERLAIIDKIEPTITKEKTATLNFWKGHTLATLGELSRANEYLQTALASGQLDPSIEESARDSLLYLAEKLEETSIADFLLANSLGDAREKVLGVQWRIATAKGNHEQAMHRAKEQSALLKEPQSLASALAKFAHSAYQCGQFEQVINCCSRFLDNPSQGAACDHLEELLIHAAPKCKQAPTAIATIERWQQVLGEKSELEITLAEIMIALGQKKKAAAKLEALAEKTPSSAIDSLLCICLSPLDPIRATDFGERALKGGESRIEEGSLHLTLFNLYCDVASQKLSLPKGHSSADLSPLAKAADHLFALFKIAPERISMKNKTWLCEYYLKQEASQTQGLMLFSHLERPSPYLMCLAAKALPTAARKKELLLQALPQAEKSNALDLICTLLAELGYAELELGEKLVARNYFARSAHMKVQSYDADRAKLALYRLDAKSHNLEKARAKSDLKDIQLRKTLDKEPLFLDAALLYVDICADSDLEKRQHLLEQMQADFCSGATLFGKHYQLQREQYPEKEALLTNYMLFVDLSIQSIDAKDDARRLRTTLAKLESSLPTLKATSPELANRSDELRRQIRSVLD